MAETSKEKEIVILIVNDRTLSALFSLTPNLGFFINYKQRGN